MKYLIVILTILSFSCCQESDEKVTEYKIRRIVVTEDTIYEINNEEYMRRYERIAEDINPKVEFIKAFYVVVIVLATTFALILIAISFNERKK